MLAVGIQCMFWQWDYRVICVGSGLQGIMFLAVGLQGNMCWQWDYRVGLLCFDRDTTGYMCW